MNATQMVPASIEDMAQRADAVVRGHVVFHSTKMNDGAVQTVAQLAVDELWAGDDVGDLVRIEAPGGRHGDIATQVAGADIWSPGEEVIAFLVRLDDGVYRSLALSMSRFSVQGEMARRDTDNITWVRRTARGTYEPATPPSRAVPIAELRQRVRQARNEPEAAP